MSELEEIKNVICAAFMCGVEQSHDNPMNKDEMKHRIKAFENSKGYKEIEQAIEAYISKHYIKKSNLNKGENMKTVKEIMDMHIKPLISDDQYNDYEQAIEELELLRQEDYKKGYTDAGIEALIEKN